MIHPMADGRFKIQVWVCFKNQRHKRQDTFEGTLQQAREREKELWLKLRQELKDNENKREETCKTFKGVINFCKEMNQCSWKSMKTYYSRVEQDCGSFPMERRELQGRFVKYFAQVDRMKSKKGKPLANGTKNLILQAAKKMVNFARKHELMNYNPLVFIKKWPTTPRQAKLSSEEQGRLIEVCERIAPQIAPALRFSLNTPIRVSDLRRLKLENLDLESMTITYTSKKTNVISVCNIYPDLENYFRTIPKRCRYLFYYKTRSRYHPLGDFKKSWKAVKKAAKIDPDLRWHDLRHVSCHTLLKAGVPVAMVQKCGNWKTLEMVQLYHSGGEVEAAKIAKECMLRQNHGKATIRKKKRAKPKSSSKKPVASRLKPPAQPDISAAAA